VPNVDSKHITGLSIRKIEQIRKEKAGGETITLSVRDFCAFWVCFRIGVNLQKPLFLVTAGI